jgi:hypothetical protein
MMQQNKLHFAFSLFWMIVNPLGWGLMVIVGLIIGLIWNLYQSLSIGTIFYFLLDENTGSIITLILFSISWGLIMGILQQFLLRRYYKVNTTHWIIATTIGISFYVLLKESSKILPFYLFELTHKYYSYQLFGYISLFISPIILGLLQWLVLRRCFYKLSFLWTIAVPIALWIGQLVQSNIYLLSIEDSLLTSIGSILLEGMMYSITTLIVFSIVTRYRKDVSIINKYE